jgi:hypothetical protein
MRRVSQACCLAVTLTAADRAARSDGACRSEDLGSRHEAHAQRPEAPAGVRIDRGSILWLAILSGALPQDEREVRSAVLVCVSIPP